jgi:hypothetical protein
MGLIDGFAVYGSNITDILNTWAQMGVFAYLLPFLMIFAVVFGILNKTTLLGTNKGVQATIALAVGLLSLQFDYVSNFFATIFPYTGIGISVLLVALILMGLISDAAWSPKVWFGIGVVIFVVVLLTTLSDIAWMGSKGYLWAESWPAILALLILLGFMALVVWGDRKKGGAPI